VERSSREVSMTVYVSLLRAVNVGGSSRIKMADLQRSYEALGFTDVRTLLASGNVVFRSGIEDRARLAKAIVQQLERELALQIEVIVRTLAEIASIVERGPVLSPRADPSKLLVMFLASVPEARAQKELQQWHKGPEMLEMRGPEIYLYYPEGVGRSKLSAAVIENKLEVAGTARNWNTLEKLLAAGRAVESAERIAKRG
jgi:uncharacterized protein (DUF1697 family)